MKRPKIIPIDKVKAKQKKIIEGLCQQLLEQGIIVRREALSSGKGWRAKSGRVLRVDAHVPDQEQVYFYLDSKIPLGEQVAMLKELLQESNRDVGNLRTGNL